MGVPLDTFLTALYMWKRNVLAVMMVHIIADGPRTCISAVLGITEALTPAKLSYILPLSRKNGHALCREDATDLIARLNQNGGID